jgi:uncharacterized membrane protein
MEYLPQIAQQGILGVLLVIALITIYFLYRENKTLQEKRIADLMANKETLGRLAESTKQTVDTILTLVQSLETRRRG